MIKRIDDLLEMFEKLVIMLAFSVLIALMVANIIQRNVFNQSSQWILEYQPVMVLWISMLGASVALKHGKHICMELVLRFLPVRLKDACHRVASFFGFLVMATGLYLSESFVRNEFELFGAKGYIALIIPFFFAATSFRYLVQIIYPVHPSN
jgi:TRAP-type C4-dicarboxylate transport system permease small subunit